MQVLRFVMLLCLVIWLGGIIFFGAVVAPTVFTVLPTHDLAGRVVNRSLGMLHWIGIISGIVFLLCSLMYSRVASGFVHPLAARNVLIVLMLALTLVSLFVVTARMNVLRTSMGVIDDIPYSDSRRIEFNQLHQWSTRLEGGVFLMGLVVLFLTGKTSLS